MKGWLRSKKKYYLIQLETNNTTITTSQADGFDLQHVPQKKKRRAISQEKPLATRITKPKLKW